MGVGAGDVTRRTTGVRGGAGNVSAGGGRGGGARSAARARAASRHRSAPVEYHTRHVAIEAAPPRRGGVAAALSAAARGGGAAHGGLRVPPVRRLRRSHGQPAGLLLLRAQIRPAVQLRGGQRRARVRGAWLGRRGRAHVRLQQVYPRARLYRELRRRVGADGGAAGARARASRGRRTRGLAARAARGAARA